MNTALLQECGFFVIYNFNVRSIRDQLIVDANISNITRLPLQLVRCCLLDSIGECNREERKKDR
jgi:hypothetical protein